MNRIRVEGLRALDEALGELKKSTALAVLRRTGKAALEPMAERARQGAAAIRFSGNLADNIEVSTRSSGYARRIAGGRQSTVEVYMGPAGDGSKKAPPQGSLQEFGTKNHGPQPFMRPAYEAEKVATVERVGEQLGEEITKAAARAARKAARAAKA